MSVPSFADNHPIGHLIPIPDASHRKPMLVISDMAVKWQHAPLLTERSVLSSLLPPVTIKSSSCRDRTSSSTGAGVSISSRRDPLSNSNNNNKICILQGKDQAAAVGWVPMCSNAKWSPYGLCPASSPVFLSFMLQCAGDQQGTNGQNSTHTKNCSCSTSLQASLTGICTALLAVQLGMGHSLSQGLGAVWHAHLPQ